MSWLGLNTAVTGMFTSQRKLYTVNHNVSNADREGYTRQKVNTSANIPIHISGKGYIGTGIGTDSIERIRDNYLDKKYRTESASLGNWDMKNSALSEIEGVLRGGQEEGINVNIDEFFATIEDLSTNPSDPSYRTSFREKTIALTKTMNETVERLYKQQKDLNFEVKTKVKQVNDYADQIRSLNSEIFVMEIDGTNANDLRDQRDLIVDKLSKLVDIEAEERTVNVEESKDGKAIEIKKYEVRIGGMSLVDHDMTSKLKYPPDRMENTVNKEEPLYKVEWEKGGALKLKGGEIKGLLEVRDGGYEDTDEIAGTDPTLVKAEYPNKANNGIPYYIKRLDEFAQTLFAKTNEIHFKGTNLNGDSEMLLFSVDGKSTGDTDAVDKRFEEVVAALKNVPKIPDPKDKTTYPNGESDTKYITDYNAYKTAYDAYKNALKKVVRAENLTVSGDIIADLNNIATIDGNASNIENNNIMKELLKTREDSKFFSKDESYQGKPEDYLTSLLSTLGTDNQQADRMKRVEDLIVKQAKNQKLSVSGVNLDEEMADMVKFQQIFNASAKMVSTFDEIYDTMINRLGMVGR